MEEEKLQKIWYKSKRIWLNISNAITGTLGALAIQFNSTVSSNFDWIKASGIKAEYIFILMAVNALVGVYLNFISKHEIITKKE